MPLKKQDPPYIPIKPTPVWKARAWARAPKVFFCAMRRAPDLVGMTNVPEAFLAREAQLCYATLAIATDYDCWLDDPAHHVTVEMVIQQFGDSVGRAKEIVRQVMAAPAADG